MRRLLLIGAGLAVAAGPALAAPCPLTPADRDVIDVQGLISELALQANACGDQAQYNAFVGRYGPALAAQETSLDAFFTRADGARGRADHDAFITNLANAQSTQAQATGSDFCPRNAPLFTEVMALDGGNELPQYAAGKDLVPAAALPECGAPAPTPSRARARRRR